MTVQCIACASFKFERGFDKEPTDWAKRGFGRCAFRPEPWVNTSSTCQRECDKFTPNAEKKVARLRAWLKKELGGN